MEGHGPLSELYARCGASEERRHCPKPNPAALFRDVATPRLLAAMRS